AERALVEREDLPVGVGGGVEIGEPLLLERGRLEEQRDLVVAPGALGAAAIAGEQLGPVAQVRGQLLEVGLGGGVVGREREHGALVVARAIGVVEALGRDAGPLTQQAQLGLGVSDARDLPIDERGHLAPLLGLLGQAQEIGVQRLVAGIELGGAD